VGSGPVEWIPPTEAFLNGWCAKLGAPRLRKWAALLHTPLRLVDDRPNEQQLVPDLLSQRAGHTVTALSGGPEAFECTLSVGGGFPRHDQEVRVAAVRASANSCRHRVFMTAAVTFSTRFPPEQTILPAKSIKFRRSRVGLAVTGKIGTVTSSLKHSKRKCATGRV